jgi:hypothetical protein
MIVIYYQVSINHDNSSDKINIDTIKTINNYIVHREELKGKYLDEYVYVTNDKIVPKNY